MLKLVMQFGFTLVIVDRFGQFGRSRKAAAGIVVVNERNLIIEFDDLSQSASGGFEVLG
jgi:hypothetical protein